MAIDSVTIKSSEKLGPNHPHLAGYPELNRTSIAETDTESAVYYSDNAMSGYLCTIILFMCSIRGFKRGPQLDPMMPRDASLGH